MSSNLSDPAADDLCFMSATALSRAFRKRELSPVEVARAVLDRIERVNPRINAFVTLRAEDAMKEALAAEKLLMSCALKDLPALFGVPVTVKDLEDTAGFRTTYGSRLYADNVPSRDAPIWARMKAAGAILLGKTTTPEFGAHCITESLLTGVTNNPWDRSRTTGGSSGGAAAAVAAGFGPLASGSDGGGSIRVPASHCGIVGLKPSPGRIPLGDRSCAYESVSVVGPMTRTVADNALMLSVVAGPDPFDPISIRESSVDYAKGLEGVDLKGLRIAYCQDLRSGPIESEVRRVVDLAATTFSSQLGCNVELVELSLPDPIDYFVNWWGPQIAMFYEDVLLPFRRPQDIHPITRMVSELGSKVDLRTLLQTQWQMRSQVHSVFAEIFTKFDLLIWPTTPCVAFAHPGEAGGPVEIEGVTVRAPAMENQRFTEAVSHAGYPAISVPAGLTSAGLPVGLQIAAGHGADLAVLRAAAAFEAVSPWIGHRPSC